MVRSAVTINLLPHSALLFAAVVGGTVGSREER